MPDWHIANAREPNSDTRDSIEDSLELLARRQAKYPGDNLVAIRLLADLVYETEAALAQRIARAMASGASWLAMQSRWPMR